jgi:CRP/FNR family transcriptional regulator, cyclic AMP receptor protein
MPPLRRSPPRPRRTKKLIRPFDPSAFLAQAGIGRTVQRYRSKQTIFSQGDRADAVFYIQEGRVRLIVLSKQGKEATIGLFGPGDFLGEGCLASDQTVRLATATAMTDSAVLRIKKKAMLSTLHREHELSDPFVRYVIDRPTAHKQTWLINSSIPARNVWPERF